VFRAIAGLYQLQGNSALARQYALEALAIAPEDKRPELQALLDSLP